MLSLGLDIARSGLNTSASEASVVSRNIANAGNLLASRKIANVVTGPGGGVLVSSITRVSNEALTHSLQSATSDAAAQEEIVSALDQLQQTVNDPELGVSPSALIGKLRDALQVHSTSPDDATAAASALDVATRIAVSLNGSSDSIQRVRMQADADMAVSVASINDLLTKFDILNKEIIKGTRDGFDVTDQLDARDDVLRALSKEIGIETLTRSNGDMAIFTDSGLTVFDGTARTVSMVASTALAPGVSGNTVFVDGVPVTGSSSIMPIESGRLSGLAAVRDQYAPKYQTQLDEIARGLVEAFRETDQSAVPALPDIPGLFTYSGATGIPASGLVVDGLAASIRVNPNALPESGGDYKRLRDGSIGDPGNPAYTYNASGLAGYSERLQGLIAELSAPRTFDTTTELGSPASLTTAAAATSGWLEQARQAAQSEVDYRTTALNRTRDALSRATGINLDEELTSLLEIERAYQTSSKLLTVIDDMYRSLLAAV